MFGIVIVAALTQSAGGPAMPQVQAYVAATSPDRSEDISFKTKPAVSDASELKYLSGVSDGFSVVICRNISAERLKNCYARKWDGQNKRLDAIALRAISKAQLSEDLAARYKDTDALAMVTFRFSLLCDPPRDAPCPSTWCMTPIPAPPPPPPIAG